MATVLLYGDTIRYPALRHEIPLEIVDPFLFVARDERVFVLTSSLEAERISKLLPDACGRARAPEHHGGVRPLGRRA